MAASAAKYCEKKQNKSAASAASPDYVKFQAVIKSAASAASPKAKSREGSSRGAPRAVVRIRSVVRPPPSSHRPPSSGAPLDLGSLDLGGCASSRLDHGLKFYGIRGGCASSRLISEFSDCVSMWVQTYARGIQGFPSKSCIISS